MNNSNKIPNSGALIPGFNAADDYTKYHERLLGDQIRNDKFRQAIAQAVKSGDIVIDIGAGSGILSLFAVEAGADIVYAVELDPKILAIAKQKVKEKETADKIKFIQANFLELSPYDIPQKADVIISETIGTVGFEEGILTLFQSAKKFMKPQAVFIPAELSMFAAPIYMHPRLERELVSCKAALPVSNIQLNQLSKTQKEGFDFLAAPKKIADIDLYKYKSPSIKSTHEFKIAIGGELCGICCWFEAHLDEHIILTNSPAHPMLHWPQTFFKSPFKFKLEKEDSLGVTFKLLSEEKYTLFIFDLMRNSIKTARITGMFMH